MAKFYQGHKDAFQEVH